jgi:hypothetical protein
MGGLMKLMKNYQKSWNKRQSELRRALESREQHEQAMDLFFSQHAVLHSAKMVVSEPWSYEDQVFDILSNLQLRFIPRYSVHSILWCIWHIARIEDVTMNLLVAGIPQVLNTGRWLEKMKIEARDTGNAMTDKDVGKLSKSIDIKALRAYRLAVGRRTREIVERLSFEDLKLKVEHERLQRVRDEGAVVPAAGDLIDYWGKRDEMGLLLMPATRHNFVHLNEAYRLKQSQN